MTTSAPHTQDLPGRRRRLSLLSLLCYATLWSSGCFMKGADATITIVSTGTRYGCRQDKALGKQLWRGYEYMAALQFVPGNLPLCPPPSNASVSPVTSTLSENAEVSKVPAPYANITVPDDGLPVALLVRSGTGCTLHDKIEFALTRIQPAGVVRYLLVDDADADSVVINDEPHNKAVEVEAVTTRLGETPNAPSSLHPSRVESVSFLDDGGNDVPLYILYISPKTQFELLDYLLKLDPAVVASGGPRISLDSRTTDGWWDGEGAIWIALSALLSACACSILLIAGGTAQGWWQPEEDHHPAPSRPQRRRLTREQVKRMLPYWRFDGTSLHAIASEGRGMITPLRDSAAEGEEETLGLVASAAAASGEASRETPATDSVIPPQPLELSLCSICLDDYEAGDRLRVLHCNHAFHGKCIGKWLVERSATCPLCKTELWDGDEEEEDDEGESDGRNAAAASLIPPPGDYGANSWDRAWHRFFTNDAYQYLPQQQQEQQQQPPQATTTLPATNQPPEISYGGPSLPMGSAEAEVAPSGPSFWRRMLSSSRRRLARRVHLMSSSSDSTSASASAMLAEPLLAHASERENGSELRTLSPRRADAASPTRPVHDDATRIQPSRQDGQRRDPLAVAEPTPAAACASSPAVPPASSSPPRQVSV